MVMMKIIQSWLVRVVQVVLALHYEGGFGVMMLVCVHIGEYACIIPVGVR